MTTAFQELFSPDKRPTIGADGVLPSDWTVLLEQVKIRSSEVSVPSIHWIERVGDLLCRMSPRMDAAAAAAALPLFFAVTGFHISRGAMPLAMLIGETAMELAVQHDLKAYVRQSYNVMGVIQMELGAYVTAREHFSRGIEIAHEIGDVAGEAKVWANVSACGFNSQMYGEAIAAAARALQLVGDDPAMAVTRMQCYQCIAVSLYHLDRHAEGQAKIAQAYREASQAATSFDAAQMVKVATTRANLCMALSQFGDATRAVDEAKAAAAMIPNTPAALEAELADLRLFGTRNGAALVSEQLKALAARMHIGSPLRKDIYYSLARLYGHNNEPMRAKYIKAFLEESRQGRIRSVMSLMPLLYNASRDPGTKFAMPDFGGAEATLTWPETSYTQNRDILESLAFAAEIHDDSTGRHAYRVGKLASLLAMRIGWSETAANELALAARLHDVGKILTPVEILRKPSELSEFEREQMQKHTLDGVNILHGNNHPLTRRASIIALHHHENWDGSGYPHGTKGQDIPMDARLTAIADVFDALTNERPYKKAWSLQQAILEIRSLKGSKFHPDLVDAFSALINDLRLAHGDDGVLDFLALDVKTSRIITNSRQITDEVTKS